MFKSKKFRKGKYRVTNWSEYNKSPKNPGDLTVRFSEEGISKWMEKRADSGIKVRGKRRRYSDVAIKTIYTIRQIFNLRLRQSEGFARSILKLLGIILPTPDYTTISRRIRDVSVDFVTQLPQGKINLIIDSTGIKVVGEREWMSYKYYLKQRRIWRKLHIGVDNKGNIVAGEVTILRASDIATVPSLLLQIKNKVIQFVGDNEAKISLYILNKVKDLGMPNTIRIIH